MAVYLLSIVIGLISCGRGLGFSSKDGVPLISGMAIDGLVMDAAFNESAWTGLQKAQREGFSHVSYRKTKSPSEYAQAFEAYAENGQTWYLV